jgi:acyl-coenzyme A thioesterase PaaI-like protein
MTTTALSDTAPASRARPAGPTPAELFVRFARWPLGTRLFSWLVTLRSPYFASISPRFVRVEPRLCEVAIHNRRAVHNHLGTVNAIALCAMCELAAGTLMQSSLPPALRWIPRGMTTRYLKKATTDLVARAEMDAVPADFSGDLVVLARVRDSGGQVVMEADITMYISPARKG